MLLDMYFWKGDNDSTNTAMVTADICLVHYLLQSTFINMI